MPPSVYRWAVVGLLWLVCVFNYADRQAIFSVFPALKAELGLTDVQLGVVAGAFMWVYAAALPVAGMVADRASRKGLILGGLLFWSLVTLATGWATEYWHLVACRALEGLGEAFYFPASMSLISDYHGPRTRSRAMGLHQSSVYVGTVLGGVVAGYCADVAGWRTGFTLFGGLGVGLAAVLVVALREPARTATARATLADAVAGAGEVARVPMAWVLTGTFVGANFVAAVFLTWMPSYLNRRFGLSQTAAGLTATLWLQAGSVVGVLAGGVLADRLAGRVRGGRPLTQAAGLLLGAPLVFLSGWTDELRLLMLALCGVGVCKGLYDANIWASLYDVVPPHRRATAQGLMNAVGWLGAGVAPVAVAAGAARYSLAACLCGTAAVYLLVGALLVVGTRRLFPRPGGRIGQTPEEAGR